MHSPASAPDIWHAGVGAEHSALLEHGMHVLVAVLQMGEVPEQSEVIRHPTHVSLAVLHTGVGAMQSVLVKQATQAPIWGPVSAHWGVAPKPAQSAFDAHGAHMLVDRLQIGVVPEQFELLVQPTHVPVASSHAGVAPAHSIMFVAEHWVHCPINDPLV